MLRRIWNSIRNPARYAGRDLEGNTYFESRSNNDPSRMKRTVQYRDTDDMWKYIGSGKRLPVQWSAWLTHTRRHPPTLEELQVDLDRQKRVLSNALMIDARDKAEAKEMKRIRQEGTHMAIEDAVHMRTERIRSDAGPTGEPAEPEPTLEAQEMPRGFSKVLPPKFVTPPTSRKTKSSKPFPVSQLLDPSAVESEIQTTNEDGGESTQSRNASPWKTTPTETESWSPKARKRG